MKNSNFNYIIAKHLIICGICGKSYFEHKSKSDNDNDYNCLSTSNEMISYIKIENLIHEVIFYFFEDKILDILTGKNISYNIENLRLNFKLGDELSYEIIGKIITKIIIMKQSTFHHAFNEFNDDIVVEVKIITDNQELKFNISQKTNLIYFYLDEFNLWFQMNKFFNNYWPKRGFNFIMGIS